jgi:hypothetical protein
MLALLLCCAVAAGAGAQVADAARPKPVPFQRGITVGEWGPDAYRAVPTKRLLNRLKTRYHVDAVTFFVRWEQRHVTSNRMRPGWTTVPDESLERAIRIARRLGLIVNLRPFIDPISGGWRGQLQPASVHRWFANYRKFIFKYAELARAGGANGFVVGTELTSLAKYEPQWRNVIRGVRERFKGYLTYQANWGVELQLIHWWDALDAISIAAYHPLASSSPYTVDQLIAGWYGTDPHSIGWYPQIEAARNQFQRPVLFTEIGYRTVEGSAIRPWDIEYVAPFSEQAQIQAYDAALQVWYRVEWFRGFHWWYVPPRSTAGLPGADHRPTRATLTHLGTWYQIRPRR